MSDGLSGDGLGVIEPEAVSARFAGQIQQIRPIRIGQLPAFSKLIKPLVDPINRALAADAVSLNLIVDLIAEGGDSFIDAVAMASGIPEKDLREGDVADLLEVVVAVLASNRDFLSHRLPQALRAMGVTGGAGPTRSSL